MGSFVAGATTYNLIKILLRSRRAGLWRVHAAGAGRPNTPRPRRRLGGHIVLLWQHMVTSDRNDEEGSDDVKRCAREVKVQAQVSEKG